jgi:formylglycine-generating enzyme required for sulfatase activity
MKWTVCVLLVAVWVSLGVSGCAEDEELPACPSDDLVVIDAPALNLSFKIDRYEASRSSASAGSEGGGASRACSVGGVKPWHSATFSEAKAACEASGKRLCTADEWKAVCSNTSLNYTYPYGNDHTAGRCNDTDGASSEVTGASAECKTLLNTFDMSGNVREWVSDGKLMGGSFSSSRLDVTCASAIAPPGGADTYAAGNGDGFRCCQ